MKVFVISLLLLCLTGCGKETVITVNADETNLYGDTFGMDSLIEIGDKLWYDSTTGIVYWWNGHLGKMIDSSTTPSAYYAPNGLPYRYNPETNTLEEIE